jgi:hypothetical protein
MEKAAGNELANTSSVIKHTGMFDNVDRLYGDFDMALKVVLPVKMAVKMAVHLVVVVALHSVAVVSVVKI